jgi:hypothetical protein
MELESVTHSPLCGTINFSVVGNPAFKSSLSVSRQEKMQGENGQI